MPKVSETFSSNTFSGPDFEKPQIFTISGVGTTQYDDGVKFVISFEEDERDFIANKTNSRIIAATYGDDSDKWAGRKLRLRKNPVPFNGKHGICVECSTRNEGPPPPQEDDIPF